MRMSNLRIVHKVGGGFSVILALLLVVGATALVGLDGTEADLTAFRAGTRATKALGQVQENLLHSNIEAKNFILSGADAERVKAEDYAKAAEETVKDMVKDVRDATQIERIQAIADAIATYRAGVGKAASLRLAELDLQDKRLKVIGPQVEQSLVAVLEAASKDGDADGALRTGLVLRHFLLARLDIQKFLALDGGASDQGGGRELAATGQGLDELQARLANGVRRTQLADVKAQLDGYAGVWQAIQVAHQDRIRLVQDALEGIGPQVAKSVDEVMQQTRSQQTDLGRRTEARVENAKAVMGVIALVAAVLGAAGSFVIGRGITQPVRAMTSAMVRLAAGDLAVVIPATANGDEIGEMAKAVQVFKDNAEKMETLRREQEQAAARAAADRKAALHRTADDFEASVLGVVEVVSASASELRSTAEAMSSAAHQGTALATTVAGAAEQATANGQTVASAAEELSSSISEISRQVAEAARISAAASEETARANHLVNDLADAANRIGQVVGLINSIAAQTNLLALNATIEAARAGDAGKGFSVVAGEVKDLANQTAKATDEIGVQISSVQGETHRAVEAIRGVAAVIDQVREISSGIASAVEQQRAATTEIARNMQQATQGTQQVSHNIGGVQAAATTTEASAELVLTAAGGLASNAERLRAEVVDFLGKVRVGEGDA